MKQFIPLLILSFYAQFAFCSQGQENLEEYLGSVKGFTAQFEQNVSSYTDEMIDQSSGNMSFKRPGKFYWTYKQPYEQEIISDGDTLWVYDKDLEQVSIRPAKQSLKNTPIMLLDDPTNISKTFNIELLSDTGSNEQIRLTPKQEDAGFKYVTLTFEESVLVGMEIYDNFDQYNRLSFHDIERDQILTDSSFHFEPPDGVDIIRAAE